MAKKKYPGQVSTEPAKNGELKSKLLTKAIGASKLGAQAVLTSHAIIAGLIGNHLKIQGLSGLENIDILVLHVNAPLHLEALQAITNATGKKLVVLPAGTALSTLSAEQMNEMGWIKRGEDANAQVIGMAPGVEVLA